MIDVLVVRSIVAALLLAASVWGGYSWRDRRADADLSKLLAAHAATKAAEVEKARNDERRTQYRIQETLDAEHFRRLKSEAAARRADAVHRGLRDDLAVARLAFDALAAHDSTATEECRAAAETGAVCADLLGRCSERRLALAHYADDAAGAGQVCVGAYRALMLVAPAQLTQ